MDRGTTWTLRAQALAGTDPACYDVSGLAALEPPGGVGTGEWVYAALKPKVSQPCQSTTFGGVVVSSDPALAIWQPRRENLDAGHHTFLNDDPTHPWRLFTGTLGNGSHVLVENFGAATNPAEAPLLTAARGSGTAVDLTYVPASCATDHVVYWTTLSGPLTGPPAWTEAACFRGDGGTTSFDPGSLAPGEWVPFVIVGNNGALEGSYGWDSGGAERREAQDLDGCDYPRVLSDTCS